MRESGKKNRDAGQKMLLPTPPSPPESGGPLSDTPPNFGEALGPPFDLALMSRPELWVRSGWPLKIRLSLKKKNKKRGSWTLSEVRETIREDMRGAQYFSGSGCRLNSMSERRWGFGVLLA